MQIQNYYTKCLFFKKQIIRFELKVYISLLFTQNHYLTLQIILNF